MASLIESIKYRNASEAPTNENNRVVTLLSLKDDGGTTSGGDDESNSLTLGTSSAVISRDVMVMAVNDAPTTIGSIPDDTVLVGESFTQATA